MVSAAARVIFKSGLHKRSWSEAGLQLTCDTGCQASLALELISPAVVLHNRAAEP